MPDLKADPGGHLAYLQAAHDAARAAPLSVRKAMLVVMLIDAQVDRQFRPSPDGDDILAYRASVAAASPALALVLDLAAMRPDGPKLVVESVTIPIEDYGALSVQDFMVSLYNHHTVQRTRIALPDGSRRDAHDLLAEAMQVLIAAT